MSKYTKILLICFLVSLPSHAFSASLMQKYVPNATEIGHGQFSYLIWPVYDITLYSPDNHFEANKPLALRLYYLRGIKGRDIAKSSIDEIQRLGEKDNQKLSNWYNQMARIFPDTQKGMILTGIYTDKKETVFLQGNKPIGIIKDPEFGQYFFDIWLGSRTKEPKLRQQLLGQDE